MASSVCRHARHGTPKEKTGANVPEGYREFLLRYSERAYSIHEGVSRAIYEFIRFDLGARYLMSQVIGEGLSVPENVSQLVEIYAGEEGMVRRLREDTPTYDTSLTDDEAKGAVGAPTYYAEKLSRMDLMALPGELSFLERIARGKKRSRSQGLRIVIQELIRLDDDARRIMREICSEGKWFIPEHICEAAAKG